MLKYATLLRYFTLYYIDFVRLSVKQYDFRNTIFLVKYVCSLYHIWDVKPILDQTGQLTPSNIINKLQAILKTQLG